MVAQGRTICPSCKKEIILDLPDKLKKIEVVCPNCSNRFFIQAKADVTSSKDECLWIEHGEPRKTILSCIKPKTKKPKIAGMLLICVLIIGLSTALFSEAFIISSSEIASQAGITGDVKLKVTDSSNHSIENATIKINGINGTTDKDGIFNADNIRLGIQNIEITNPDYKNQTIKKLVIPFFSFETKAILEEGVGYEEKDEYDSLACSMILIIFLVFTCLAIIACFKRKTIDVALFGSFISIFTFGFFFIGSILSLISFILIYKSMEEFNDEKKGKIF